MSEVSPNDVASWIQDGMPNAQVKVVGDGRHFDAEIISTDFAGMSTLQRHRAVYTALGDKMHATIHALSMKTLTPDEV